MRPVCLFLFSAFVVSGCDRQSERWESVDWELEETVAGKYTGELQFVAKGQAGPIVLATESCTNDAVLWLNAKRIAKGTLGCDFGGDIGEVSIALDGVSFELPLIDGTLDASVANEPLELEWEGGFTSERSFFGETQGAKNIQGIHVVFEGWFDVSRVNLLGPR